MVSVLVCSCDTYYNNSFTGHVRRYIFNNKADVGHVWKKHQPLSQRSTSEKRGKTRTEPDLIKSASPFTTTEASLVSLLLNLALLRSQRSL